MTGILTRTESSPAGTFGTLEVEGLHLYTVELPWRGNERNVSCIPAGEYDVIRWDSPSKGDCFKVLDVPGREDILIHVANTIRDLEGCIGPGRARGLFQPGSRPGVVRSRLALADLKAIAPDGFRLTIIDQFTSNVQSGTNLDA